jgi:hypothetical protein
LILERLYLGVDCGDLILHNLQLLHLLVCQSLGGVSGLLQRLDLQENGVVVDDVDDVAAEESGGL